jgi:hypothetical protein
MMLAGGFICFRYGTAFIEGYFATPTAIYDGLLLFLFIGSILYFLIPSLTSKGNKS